VSRKWGPPQYQLGHGADLHSTIGIFEGKAKVGISKLLSCEFFETVRLKLGSVAVNSPISSSMNRQFLSTRAHFFLRPRLDKTPVFHAQLDAADVTWILLSVPLP
jgi:hypothetical protein